jgi:hypothetical protein
MKSDSPTLAGLLFLVSLFLCNLLAWHARLLSRLYSITQPGK